MARGGRGGRGGGRSKKARKGPTLPMKHGGLRDKVRKMEAPEAEMGPVAGEEMMNLPLREKMKKRRMGMEE